MEIDGKMVGTVAASVVAAGLVGAIASEISTAQSIAGLKAQLTSLKESFILRVEEAGREHEAIKNELNARIDRLEERKADR